MSNKPQDAENSFGIADRRLHARRKDISLAYIEIGESNGGIILNISEGGLVLTAAEPLTDDRLLPLRFQLPGSKDWVEASGEIARISESKREAGVRFVDLSEHARNQIKSWMSSQAPIAESRREASGISRELEGAPNSLPADSSASADPESDASAALPQASAPNSMSAADVAVPALDANHTAPRPAPQARQSGSDIRPHVENPVPKPDRRRHPRRRDISLAYIDLGGDNGGIIVNISESGLALAAAAPLHGDRLPAMRFQLPGSADWIEASGEIAWISESKREAGVRFLAMKDEDRERIRIWVASETASRESQRVANKSREKGGRLLVMPAARVMKNAAPAPAEFEHAASEYAKTLSASSSNRGILGTAASAAAALPNLTLPERAAVNPEANAAAQPVQIVAQPRSWRKIAGIVVLASAVSFLAGWFAAGPATRNRIYGMFARSSVETSKPAAIAAAPSTSAGGTASVAPVQKAFSNANSVAHPPARAAASDASAAAAKVTPPGHAVALPSRSAAANLPSSPPEKARVEQPRPVRAPSSSTAGDSPRTVENARAPSASSDAASPKESVSPPVSQTPASQLIVSQPEVARAADAAPPANSAPTKPIEPPEVFKGTVTVSFSPYPSIRVPAELKAQISRQGASLQIGRLTLRVDPTYPADAERQHIEGTVRVHVIVGRDGAVQSVALMSGSSLLARAATNAVLQWRYQPTTIGGQAVEAEEDVIVVFKMVSQASRPN